MLHYYRYDRIFKIDIVRSNFEVKNINIQLFQRIAILIFLKILGKEEQKNILSIIGIY